ncbi:MAG: methyltransferase domain-containing protein [Candidatus Dormibacteraeota bacterium]|nr:methyltransferase domain-containing protein [Candidatus Dormibacteraeota bacterium]
MGCGSYPLFLNNTRFHERYGVDRVKSYGVSDESLTLIEQDIADGAGLPFEDAFFDVVTLLAVFEHLDLPVLEGLLREIHRVLRPGGVFVMTTPAAWTEAILRVMAYLRLVSGEEVGEHKATYSPGRIVSLLATAGFDSAGVRHGTFEARMNLWAAARKRV